MDWLKAIAPLVATALGGPLGGAAAAFVADRLGLDDRTVEAVTNAIQSGSMSPDQIALVKGAELDFQKFLATNKIDLERVHAGDRVSARGMQESTRSWVPGILAVVIVAGFFGVLLGMMSGQLQVNDQQALLILLGALSAGFGAVLNFYYGSSAGSQNKDQLLARAGPVK